MESIFIIEDATPTSIILFKTYSIVVGLMYFDFDINNIKDIIMNIVFKFYKALSKLLKKNILTIVIKHNNGIINSSNL